MRDRLETMIGAKAGDPYIDSTDQLDDINEAYRATADAYDWPQTVRRFADPIVANVGTYATQTDFRKFSWMKVNGVIYLPCDFDVLIHSPYRFAVDKQSSQYQINPVPSTASTAYTTSNSETAGNAVVIELDTVSGLAAGDEIWISDTTSSEVTYISSVDTSAVTITAKLKNNHTSGKSLYRTADIIFYGYHRNVTTISGTDTIVLPDSVDFEMLHYAAYLFYDRLEQNDKADSQLKKWEMGIARAWQAHDSVASGAVNELSVW